jgi:hypothetical protein
MQATSSSATSSPRLQSPYLIVVLGWLLPGSGHLLLGRRGRGAIIFATVLACFALGVLMRGPMFQPGGADLLSRLIQFGGFVGDLASGLFYFVAIWFGYSQPDVAGHTPDYGSKFLVAAGLLNILAMVDAYEIATRQKE